MLTITPSRLPDATTEPMPTCLLHTYLSVECGVQDCVKCLDVVVESVRAQASYVEGQKFTPWSRQTTDLQN